MPQFLFISLSFLLGLTIIGLIILRPKKQEKIDVSFKELSSIWTPFNDSYETLPPSSESDPIQDFFNNNQIDKNQETSDDTKNIEEEKDENISVKSDKETQQVAVPEDNEQEKDIASITLGPFKRFWEECVKPYEKSFIQQNVMDIVKELISLLEKHGHCPSVVIDNIDNEAIDLMSVRDNLAQVSLKEHTYAVARHLVEAVKKSYVDPENHIPKAVIAALAHDIGKIEEFRKSKAYNTNEHQLISSNKLMEMFTGKDVFWARQAVNAVENHHAYPKDDFGVLLKRADQEARQLELIKFTKDLEILPFEKWFKTDEFYKEINPYINYMQSPNRWEAFTFRGIIYCKPDFVYDTAKKLCRKAKILDLTFIYESEKESVLRKVVSALRNSDLIPDFLDQNYYARKFEIKTQMGKNNTILTPVKLPSSYNLNKIEKRKMGYLEVIRTVIPLGKK